MSIEAEKYKLVGISSLPFPTSYKIIFVLCRCGLEKSATAQYSILKIYSLLLSPTILPGTALVATIAAL